MSTQPLLIEIGCEELPPKSLLSLVDSFSQNVCALLNEKNISVTSSACTPFFGTPRRLVLFCKSVPTQQPDKQIQRKGPAINAAYDKEGNPTKAALGFAQSCGVAFDALEKLSTPQGEWLVFNAHQKGMPTISLLSDVISQALLKLPIAKRMRWGTSHTEFVRPIHWVLGLLGDEVIPGEILGIKPGRITYGHRFHHPEAIEIKHPDEYADMLCSVKVEPDFNKRLKSIDGQIEAEAEKINVPVRIDKTAWEEVTALTEWPVALTGKFDEEFLDVPHEALVSTMTGNQKYFPVFDAATGKMLPKFIFITNIESKDPAQIIAGNEKVIRPRFSDAKFFFEQDKKISLESRLPELDKMMFHPKLGTLKDKSMRLVAISREIAKMLSVHQEDGLPEKAAMLCKTDLITNMVFEFPELQGTMGYYYALNDGEPEAVAIALKEHYLPRFANDELPESRLGQILALADRFDTIAGIFAIGQAPTGDKDPFALRRAALGILRILIHKELPCDLKILVAHSLSLYPDTVCKNKTAVVEQIMEFLFDRLRGFYQGLGTDITHIQRLEFFTAVRAASPSVTNVFDFDLRMHALAQFWDLPQAKELATANKRASNILSKEKQLSNQLKVNPSLLTEAAEKELFEKLESISHSVTTLSNRQTYSAALIDLATLRDPVYAFFDHVMVNIEDHDLRNNRLALLQQLRALFIQIADISLILITHQSTL